MRLLKILNSKTFLKFIVFGTLLTLLSQSSLLIMLLFLPLGLSTFLTQILHNYFAYLANKFGVFNKQGKPFAYILLVILSWAIQWLLIKTLVNFGFSSLLAVIVATPFLAIFSFITQKFIVFK
tara:strand:+ start:411 stop:779 length:369 start_codon:yes stop_codon:yes gene_type:complete